MWLPNPTVTINGQDYTGVSVNQVTIRRGRDTVYNQANAGVANIELIDIGTLTRFEVGSDLQISMLFPAIEWELLADSWAGLGETWDGAFGPLAPGFIEPVFTGVVSDWDADAIAARDNPVMRYRVTGIGPLATLNRRNIFFDGRVAENDGERAEAILTAALGTAVVDPSIIDAGVFDLAAIDAAENGYKALELLSNTGQSAEGVLFETKDGRIGYADADRRFATTDFVEVPFASVEVGRLSVSSQLADVTNVVTVSYDGGAVTVSDAESIAIFGEQDTSISTTLASEAQALTFADLYLQRHLAPSVSLGRLGLNLRNMDPDLRVELLNADVNTGILLTNIPRRVGFRNFEGFVEGVELVFSQFEARIGLFVSDGVLSTGDMRWAVVPPGIIWDEVEPPTLIWDDARVIA
jgi:hypothetical protein